MVEKRIQTMEELHALAGTILSTVMPSEKGTVFALKGDLGAGKTAFTKVLAKHLGIAHEITSPTFVIMKSYEIPAHPLFKTLIHIDAYRIEDEEEMRVLKLEELLSNANNLICIEWPEKIKNLIPKDAHTIAFTLNHDGTRDIAYSE